MSLPRFFYLVPKGGCDRLAGESRLHHLWRSFRENRNRSQKPLGGVFIIYQHCEMLNRLGFFARPVHVDGRFSVDWFQHGLTPLDEKSAQAEIGETDIVICPEIIPAFAVPYRARRKVVFVQGWSLIDLALRDGRRYEDFGFTSALACSEYARRYLGERSALPCAKVTNGIDLAVYVPSSSPPQPNRVMFLARRNAADGHAAIAMLPPELRQAVDLAVVTGPVSRLEMARLYREADIFLAIGYPEGFAMPPLEAMASGCAVAGFTGRGADEFMIDGQTALVAPDGDAAALSRQLARLLADPGLKEQIRAAGMAKAREYSLDRMEGELAVWAAAMAGTSGGGA
jgi:glycosyltransferase involved in cell wall biosynthesis